MSGALYWPAENALIVADLHLEKGSAFAARGQMLPPYDTRETLDEARGVIDTTSRRRSSRSATACTIRGAAARMDPPTSKPCTLLQEDRDWIWITGNHDPEIERALGGHVFPEITVEGITLRHEPAPGAATHEIAGHFHPAARLVMHGTALRRPCFVGNGLRLVLPAFGAYTGGLNILDDAFEPFFGNDGMAVWMLGQEGLYPVAPRLLRED